MGAKKYVVSLEYMRGEREISTKRHKGGRLIKELQPMRLELLDQHEEEG